jgi:preprotein translocase subunit SecE
MVLRPCLVERQFVATMSRETVLMARYNPVEFINEVRHEVSKVTWPTFREVWITTVLVGIMVTMASLFFLLADYVLGNLVKMLLSLGS